MRKLLALAITALVVVALYVALMLHVVSGLPTEPMPDPLNRTYTTEVRP